MSNLTVKNLFVSYSPVDIEINPIINVPNLNVNEGEIIGLFGPNHVGKSTFLKAIGQLHEDIYLSEKSELRYSKKIHNRNTNEPLILHVPQDYTNTIYPWFSIIDNLTIIMKALSFSESLIKNKVSDFCVEFGYQNEKELFNDYGFYDGEKEKKVSELSGGQKQILTVIRAILTSPDILIMDEPFSAIDIYKGTKFRKKVFSFIRANNITTFFIGHTLDELVLFSDRIIFCDHDSKGKIIQGIEDIPESDDGIVSCLNNWKEKYGHS